MTVFVLKLIACTTMFIDHFGATFDFLFNAENLRCVGRMAFPIYVYLISEGTRHTSDLKKYMLRLGFFAIISELPYDLLLSNSANYPSTDFIFLEFGHQNIFFTLFLGVLGVYFWKESQKVFGDVRDLYLFFMCMTVFAGAVFNTDYGFIGVAIIIICSIVENKNYRIALLYAAFLLLSFGLNLLEIKSTLFILLSFGLNPLAIKSALFSLLYFGLNPLAIKSIFFISLSILLIYFYNGKKGPSAKWLFYAFYPCHLLFLFGLYYFYLV